MSAYEAKQLVELKVGVGNVPSKHIIQAHVAKGSVGKLPI